MNDIILECEDISKTYHDGTSSISVLNKVRFAVKKGDRIAIVGASGSGKSTLLHLLGGVDKPSEGQLLINGVDWQTVSEKKRCQLRNHNLGFIYQFHHLLPEFSALENVAMPLLLAEYSVTEAQKQAHSMLKKVGLAHRASHKPSQLSGGERQRVAIARALVHQPQCVLADEPTGNLDHTTAMKVFDLMLSLNEQLDTALVIVTHDGQLASKMDSIYTIRDGTVWSGNEEMK